MRKLFVATPPGLESVAVEEIRALGMSDARPVAGGVACTADAAGLVRLHLASRIASRIQVLLLEVPLAAFRRSLAGVDFGAVLAPGAPFAIEVSGGGSRPFELSRPVEEAIARQVRGARPVPKGEAVQRFFVRLHRGVVQLGADATGAHLHLRGYRQETSMAPLQENVAAGILALAGYRGETTLFDPMCGSGTFLIEGAMVALRLPPGLGRSFACESWPAIPPETVAAEREALRTGVRGALSFPIVGSDRHAGALGVARRNAQRAGLFEHLQLQRADATAVSPPAGAPGLLVTNPPWGRRVGEGPALADLYRRFGGHLRQRFVGWRVAILVADRSHEALLELPTPTVHPLRTGGLPCRLLVARL